MKADQWLKAFSAELGTEGPSPETIEVLLELAGVAAHASERIAAPIACYMVGVMGMDPNEALDVARRVSPPSP